MRDAALSSVSTAALAVLGFYLGTAVHGPGPTCLVPAAAAGALGFALGCAGCRVLELRGDRRGREDQPA